MNKLKPSEICKLCGLKSLQELTEITGESAQNLINWHRDQPRRFELILKGAIFERQMQIQQQISKQLKLDS